MHFHSSSCPHEVVMAMNDTPNNVFNTSREISNDTLSYQLYTRMHVYPAKSDKGLHTSCALACALGVVGCDWIFN